MAKKPKKTVKTLKRIALTLAIGFCGYILTLTAVIVWTFEVKLHRRPIFIYGAPFTVQVGDDLTKIAFLERLRRLGYAAVSTEASEPGQWSRSGSDISICLRHSPVQKEGIVGGPINLSMDWNRIRSIRLMRSLEEINRITLEPELIQIIAPAGDEPELCRPVPLKRMPSLLVDAVVLTEDEHFFSHGGIDFSSIRRALEANWRARRYVQGGSTISQQLIRMTLLNPEKTLWRKLNEIFLSLVADAVYSKETILEAYLNRVYLGQQGSYPVHGVAEGARTIFGKDFEDLDVADCAFIAATIRAPNVIHPMRHPDRARDRRNMVLERMFKAGKISRDVYEETIETPVKVVKSNPVSTRAGTFLELAKALLPPDMPGKDLTASSQNVTTSLDPFLQAEIETALKNLEGAGDQAYVIVAVPRSGDIKALLAPTGTRYWSGEGGNPAVFLPFLLIPALTSENHAVPQLTLSSRIHISDDPQDSFTLRRAFHDARSALLDQLLTSVGPERLVDILKEFGIQAEMRPDGTVNVHPLTPLKMAESYCLLATLGTSGDLSPHPDPAVVPDQPQAERKREVLNPSACYLVNHLLKTAELGRRPDDAPDTDSNEPSLFTAVDKNGCWSIAYRNDVLVLLRIPGTSFDFKRIKSFMMKIIPPLRMTAAPPPAPPNSVMFRKICGDSGLRATSLCPHVIKEAFLKGTQPVEWCPLQHGTGQPRPTGQK